MPAGTNALCSVSMQPISRVAAWWYATTSYSGRTGDKDLDLVKIVVDDIICRRWSKYLSNHHESMPRKLGQECCICWCPYEECASIEDKIGVRGRIGRNSKGGLRRNILPHKMKVEPILPRCQEKPQKPHRTPVMPIFLGPRWCAGGQDEAAAKTADPDVDAATAFWRDFCSRTISDAGSPWRWIVQTAPGEDVIFVHRSQLRSPPANINSTRVLDKAEVAISSAYLRDTHSA